MLYAHNLFGICNSDKVMMLYLLLLETLVVIAPRSSSSDATRVFYLRLRQCRPNG
jgi:hypothetical protein